MDAYNAHRVLDNEAHYGHLGGDLSKLFLRMPQLPDTVAYCGVPKTEDLPVDIELPEDESMEPLYRAVMKEKLVVYLLDKEALQKKMLKVKWFDSEDSCVWWNWMQPSETEASLRWGTASSHRTSTQRDYAFVRLKLLVGKCKYTKHQIWAYHALRGENVYYMSGSRKKLLPGDEHGWEDTNIFSPFYYTLSEQNGCSDSLRGIKALINYYFFSKGLLVDFSSRPDALGKFEWAVKSLPIGRPLLLNRLMISDKALRTEFGRSRSLVD